MQLFACTEQTAQQRRCLLRHVLSIHMRTLTHAACGRGEAADASPWQAVTCAHQSMDGEATGAGTLRCLPYQVATCGTTAGSWQQQRKQCNGWTAIPSGLPVCQQAPPSSPTQLNMPPCMPACLPDEQPCVEAQPQPIRPPAVNAASVSRALRSSLHLVAATRPAAHPPAPPDLPLPASSLATQSQHLTRGTPAQEPTGARDRTSTGAGAGARGWWSGGRQGKSNLGHQRSKHGSTHCSQVSQTLVRGACHVAPMPGAGAAGITSAACWYTI